MAARCRAGPIGLGWAVNYSSGHAGNCGLLSLTRCCAWTFTFLAKEEGNAVPLCRAKPTPSFINLQASSPPATCLKIPATKLSSGTDHKPKECLGLLELGFSRGYMDVISQQIGYRPLINQAIHHYRPELHVYSTSGHFCHTKLNHERTSLVKRVSHYRPLFP
ncbi:TSSK6-activating co-chaperone protein [Pseudorca crassidens]|uniref:TSSK6-activating co-chaperone protein n=1 Tax=Pseudorca crassidens TaxID=82174 RepID=UPI00352D4791